GGIDRKITRAHFAAVGTSRPPVAARGQDGVPQARRGGEKRGDRPGALNARSASFVNTQFGAHFRTRPGIRKRPADGPGDLPGEEFEALRIEIRQRTGKGVIDLRGSVIRRAVMSVGSADNQFIRAQPLVPIDDLEDLRPQSGRDGKQIARHQRQPALARVLEVKRTRMEACPITTSYTPPGTMTAQRYAGWRSNFRLAGARREEANRGAVGMKIVSGNADVIHAGGGGNESQREGPGC